MTIAARNHTAFYTSFGSCMQSRGFSSATYRYGFNGKEKEADGTADNYDFGARIYDGRLGRFLSVDPENSAFTSFSCYNFATNNPILCIDVFGKGAKITTDAENKTITISANFKFFGAIVGEKTDENGNSNPNIKFDSGDAINLIDNAQTQIQSAVSKYLQENGGKITIDGVEYTNIKVDFHYEVISEQLAETEMNTNTDPSINYFLVHDGSKKSRINHAECNPEGEDCAEKGGNMGYLKLSDLYDEGTTDIGNTKEKDVLAAKAKEMKVDAPYHKSSSTFTHEVLHGMGLLPKAKGGDGHGHPKEIKLNPDGTVPVMTPSGTHVSIGGTLKKVNVYDRVVQSSDIKNLDPNTWKNGKYLGSSLSKDKPVSTDINE